MMNVFITGVSSGIGKSLAYFYAEQGATVGICARRQNRLQIVEEKIKSLGGEAIPFILDVADQEACQMAIEQFLAETESIDIVIANAGIGGVDDISSGSPSTMNKILSINILGVTNTITPFIPIMKKQKFGRICIISSVAGTRGMVAHGAYSASKAAVRILGDSWDYSLSRHKISTTVIFPGWIATEMTENHKFKMPFLMTSDTAAKKNCKRDSKREADLYSSLAMEHHRSYFPHSTSLDHKTFFCIMIQDIHIRFAIESDFEYLHWQYPLKDEILLHQIRSRYIMIAELKGQQVGHIRYELLWGHLPFLSLIMVKSKFRKQGIGKELLSFLEDVLRLHEHPYYISSSVENEPAPQKWHRHMKFQEVGLLSDINDNGDGEIFFRKSL